MIDNDNHSKIFISKENRYYVRGDNKSIHVKILNEFEDIRKSYGISVIDITENYYKINEPSIIKHCTILLIDDYNHNKIFISEKNLCYINRADADDNDFVNDYDIYDYDDDYHDDFFVNYDELVYYKKPLNCFECLVSVKNNIKNLINNDNNNHNIVLLVDDFNILICGNK